VKHLIVLNDPPHGTDRSQNGLRMAHLRERNDPEAEITVFPTADAVPCGKAGRKTQDGFHSIEHTIRRFPSAGGRVLMCGSCRNARGMTENDMRQRPTHSTMDDLARAPLAAGKVLAF
jgi:uncharacterized protein involved in oxidation of intracellular sulfur